MNKPAQPTRRQVYMLWFSRDPDEEMEIIVGIYGTEAEAQSALRLRADKPGFRDFPDGFHIDSWVLGRSSWDEGFVLYGPNVEREVPKSEIRPPNPESDK